MIKIAFRNFFSNFKLSLLVILGSMIATMLVVGALSLNDSVNSWFNSKLRNNFGNIDIVAKDKSDTFFFPKTLNVEQVEKYLNKYKNEGVVKDFVFTYLVSSRIKHNGNFYDIFAIGYDEKIKEFSKKDIDGIILSSDLAKTLNITQGDTITIITPSGSKELKIDHIGLEEFNFRGETGMTNGSIFIPKDLMLNLRMYTYNAPNTVFISLNLDLKKHLEFSEKLSKDLDLRTTPTKYNLKYSPLNKVIGYLFLGFSGFSILSSFLFISNFFGVLAEDRRKTLGTLRALGLSKKKSGIILFLEGLMYIISSSIVGALLGIIFGRYLLSFVNNLPNIASSDTTIAEKIPYVITYKSIFLGILISIILPIILLITRSISFSKIPPVVLLSEEQILPKKRWVFILAFLIVVAFFFINPLYSLSVLIILISVFFKKSYVQLLAGVLSILTIYNKIGTGERWDYLARSGIFLAASVVIIFSILPLIKNVIRKFYSLSNILAISYIEKQKMRNYIVFFVYAIITLVILLTAVIPSSVFNYVDKKLDSGIVGYNFLIIENPLKSFFKTDYYETDENFKSMFENLVKIQLVNAKLDNRNLTIILAKSGIEKSLKIENVKVNDLSLKEGIANKEIFSKDSTYTFLIKGILPGISARFYENFKVVDTFDPKNVIVPFDGIFVYDKKVSGALQGYAGVVKDEYVNQAKNTIYEKFDAPLYVTEELNKVFLSIKYFINVAVQLFYFGFISGFSGLTILSLKNVYERKRIIGSLKALGVNRKTIFSFFITEAFLIVTIAILTAIITTFFITMDLTTMISSELPDFSITIPWIQIIEIIAGIYLITSIFTIYPANLAQKISPAEAIRVFD
ncbi:putative ABC transport system permease protein [Thermosipho japonicus]|uniref:Putative ABC transport system permease protein n=1 Tax=Thermosipho japonicus TaxID=90323 RepID=A0A841GR56_9BACT|nr:ABC transporter permease [Thermosipho japonicus]MBB6062149.1 putative ABC transport system permease protein [Thermosipho japonicus]